MLVETLQLGMAMRMRQMRNNADNVRICANIREYMRICASIRIGKIWRMAIPNCDTLKIQLRQRK